MTEELIKNFYEDDIGKEPYLGIVEDNVDPKKIFRCKVRVIGKFGYPDSSKNKIPVADLPWCYPVNANIFTAKNSGGGGSYSVPKIGSVVRIKFDGSIYHPKYTSVEDVSPEASAAVGGSYENSHVLAFDKEEDLRMYYTKTSGLLIYLKGSLMNIRADNSILINHKDSRSTIELKGPDIDIITENSTTVSSPNNVTLNSQQVTVNGTKVSVGANPIYKAVNGDILMALLDAMAVMIDAKTPTSGGACAELVAQFRSLILSETVTTTP